MSDGFALEGRLEIGDEDRRKALDDILNEPATIELSESSAEPPGKIHLNQAVRLLPWNDAPFQPARSVRSGANISAAATQTTNPPFRIKPHFAVAVERSLHRPQGDIHPTLDTVPLKPGNLCTGQARRNLENIGLLAPVY